KIRTPERLLVRSRLAITCPLTSSRGARRCECSDSDSKGNGEQHLPLPIFSASAQGIREGIRGHSAKLKKVSRRGLPGPVRSWIPARSNGTRQPSPRHLLELGGMPS